MGKTIRPGILANLDADKLEALNTLATETRVPRAEYLREAVDDLLVKYGKAPPDEASVPVLLRELQKFVVRFAGRTNERLWARKGEALSESVDAALQRLDPTGRTSKRFE